MPYETRIETPNLIGMMGGAAQLRRMQEESKLFNLQRQQLSNQIANQQQMGPALTEAFAGQDGRLQQIDPDMAMKIQMHNIDKAGKTAKNNDEAIKASKDTMKISAQFMLGKIAALEQDPQLFPRIKWEIMQAARNGMVSPDAASLLEQMQGPPPPEALQQFKDELSSTLASLDSDEMDKDIASAATMVDGIKPSDIYQTMRGIQTPKGKELMTQYQKLKETQAKAGADVVNLGQGNMEVEKSVKAKLQGELIDLETTLGDLKDISSMDSEAFLSLGGRLKGKILGAADYFMNLSPDSKEYISNRAEFVQKIQTVFNEYRRRITGSSAAMSELKYLEDAIVNGNLSPTVFSARLRDYMGTVSRAIRIKRKVLSQGINISPDEQASLMDTAWRGGDMGNDAKDVATQLKKLLAAGMSPEAAKKAMVSDEYWTQEQGDNWLLKVGKK